MAATETEMFAEALAQRFPRVAISHEWLTIPGGSEKVVLAILELLPHAEIFTSVYDPSPWPEAITQRPVHASFLDRVPSARRRYTHLVPLMDRAFRSFDLSGFDLVVSSNHASAKNVRVPPGAVHVCYCHTPMRYAWDPGFLEGERLGPVMRRIAPLGAAWLRGVDRRRAAGPDQFVANSTYVASRIRDAYGRDSVVIHPPVEVDRWLEVPRDPQDAYLFFGRVVPYKRADVAVEACRRLGRKLIIAGEGRDLERVRAAGASDTEFIGHVPDDQVPALFSRSRALLFPGVEDFGIVPVEAQAAGLPVIANAAGGVRDSVIDGETGILYDPGTVEGLCRAIERFEAVEHRFEDSHIRANAMRFGAPEFRSSFASLLMDLPQRADSSVSTAEAEFVAKEAQE